MTLDGVYLRMIGSTKDPHWLPHFILDKLLLQEIAYQNHINVVSSSLIKARKGVWPPFPLSKNVCRMDNNKQPKKKLVYYIPLNLEKQVSEDMILKVC